MYLLDILNQMVMCTPYILCVTRIIKKNGCYMQHYVSQKVSDISTI